MANDLKITPELLKSNKKLAYCYGENNYRKGKTSAEKFRKLKNAFGFIVKRDEYDENESHYLVDEYRFIYYREMIKLKEFIRAGDFETVYIAKLGAKSANRYGILENIIEPRLKLDLAEFEGKIVYLF